LHPTHVKKGSTWRSMLKTFRRSAKSSARSCPLEIKALAREIVREVVAEQRRQELAAYEATLDFDQVAKIQRAKMREHQRAKRTEKAAAKGPSSRQKRLSALGGGLCSQQKI